MADWLHQINPDIKIRCVADSPDYIPWGVHARNCRRRKDGYQQFVNGYWSRDMDHSCQEYAFNPENRVQKPEEQCGILSKALPFIKTDMFILVSLKDPAISNDYGCFFKGNKDRLAAEWIENLHALVTNETKALPKVGWFVPSCPLHVIYSHKDSLDILVKDINTGENLSPYTALKKWYRRKESNLHSLARSGF